MDRKRRIGKAIFNLLVMALTILAWQGCVLISALSGPKELKVISTSKLIEYMVKTEIDTSQAYYLTKAGLVNLINADINPGMIQIFNKTGQLYTVYSDGKTCQAKNESFFSGKFDTGSLTPIYQSLVSSILDSTLVNLNGKPMKSFNSILDKKEYTVVIYWATSGLYNKHISDWQEAVKKDNSLQVITVDLDPNTNWDKL